MSAENRNAHTSHHGNLREVLVAQALQLVEREGVSSVTLDDVTRLAGASPAEVAAHFAGRSELLQELSGRGFGQLAEAMAAAARGWADPAKALHESSRAYVGFAVEHPNLFRLMLGPHRATPASAGGEGRRAVLQVLFDAVARARAPEALDLGAALPAWAAAHGLATLLIDDQLRGLGLTTERWGTAVALGLSF